jgi:hypothetical protein
VIVSFVAPGFASQAASCIVPVGETAWFDFRASTAAYERPVSYRCKVEPATLDRYTLQ